MNTPSTSRSAQTSPFPSTPTWETTNHHKKRYRSPSPSIPSEYPKKRDMAGINYECLTRGERVEKRMMLQLLQSAAALHPLSFRVVDPALWTANAQLPESVVLVVASTGEGVNKQVDLYDPLPEEEADHDQEIAKHLKTLAPLLGLGFSINRQPIIPLQSANDCGIAVISTVLHLVAGESLPKSTNYGMWRRVLMTMATGQAKDLVGSSASGSAIDVLPVPPPLPETIDRVAWKAWKKQQAAIQRQIQMALDQQMEQQRKVLEQSIVELTSVCSLLNALAARPNVPRAQRQDVVVWSNPSVGVHQVHELDRELVQSQNTLQSFLQCGRADKRSIEELKQWINSLPNLQAQRQKTLQRIILALESVEKEVDALKQQLEQARDWENESTGEET
nr:uncharacterized protein CTRU02_15083 [Colletotrichum truncatum]KAF6781443.1 hypothetical protein CTRU02_15083 [Colletotrichum truncatum]